jgi:hypothetical protein
MIEALRLMNSWIFEPRTGTLPSLVPGDLGSFRRPHWSGRGCPGAEFDIPYFSGKREDGSRTKRRSGHLKGNGTGTMRLKVRPTLGGKTRFDLFHEQT